MNSCTLKTPSDGDCAVENIFRSVVFTLYHYFRLLDGYINGSITTPKALLLDLLPYFFLHCKEAKAAAE